MSRGRYEQVTYPRRQFTQLSFLIFRDHNSLFLRVTSDSVPLSYQNDNEAWAVGGGGSLWYSTDGGQTFKFSSGATNIGANLYDVKFFGGDKGFAIGSDGVLLK